MTINNLRQYYFKLFCLYLSGVIGVNSLLSCALKPAPSQYSDYPNSGNSNLPHLHYHLQNTPHWLNGAGLPMQFVRYYANGRYLKRGEPVQGEIISTVPPTKQDTVIPE